MQKNILLIGGAGYVGTVITSYFLKKNHKVTVLDSFIYDNQFSVHSFLGDENYEFIHGDFCKKSVLEKSSKNITDVIILGGLVGDPITKSYPEQSNTINSKGVIDCIDFFKDKEINKLVFISTCSNYGLIKESELADENFALNPLSLYAKAKVAAEEHILSLKDEANFTGVILRFATAFGLSPRMRFDLSISEFTKELFFGNELEVFDEHTWRPYCHVGDFARLIDLVLNADNKKVHFEVFNAGGDKNNATKQMILDNIVKYLPDSKITYTPNGSDPRNYKVSFNKVKTVLGFEPKYSVDYGVKELINSLQSKIYSDSVANKIKYGNYTIDY